MSRATNTKGLSVETYEKMVNRGILPETNRFELIEGRIVEKDVKDPAHSVASAKCLQVIARTLPAGWHVRGEQPVRIPSMRSEPEPDISVVRGELDDYVSHHPGPGEVALVVEVARTTVAKDRRLARVYAGGGIPAYWILHVSRRQLEVYSAPVSGAYPPPAILNETDTVELPLDSQTVAKIAVAELLPRRGRD